MLGTRVSVAVFEIARGQVLDTSKKHGPEVNTIKDHLSKNTSKPVPEIFVQTKRKWTQTFTLESFSLSFASVPEYENVASECQTA